MERQNKPMINDALRLLRLYLGLSQKQIAVELGLSQSMVSEIESSAKPVSMEVLERYSTSFNVRMSQLLFFAEELNGEPVKKRGKLFIADRVLAILDKLSPREVADG